MRIVSQSASLSYSPFLALPAPKIAGLLPARVGASPRFDPPKSKPFVYDDPGLAALSDKTRVQLDKLLTTLLEATVGLLADVFTEAEFALANGTFVRQVAALYHGAIIGDPKPAAASPFAARRQQLDEKIDVLVAQSKVHLAETRERIARELAALHAQEGEL